MVTKTITIMEDAYKILSKMKNKNESFSEVIRRIGGEKKNIMKFAGAWNYLKEDEIKSMEKRILSIRKKSTKDLLKKLEKNDMS